MSNRSDIIDGKLASVTSKGLIYTCRLGWVDLGHAIPDGPARLWRSISSETGTRSKDGKGFKVTYGQSMSKFHLRARISNDYYVRVGLSQSEKESVALSIFLETSFQFEAFQSRFPYSWATKSGFSAEDLVSDLLSFYRAVKPGTDFLLLAQPVSKEAALKIWDSYGDVGDNKNYSPVPYLYPCPECQGVSMGPVCAQLPSFLRTITPATKGHLFRNWHPLLDLILPLGTD